MTASRRTTRTNTIAPCHPARSPQRRCRSRSRRTCTASAVIYRRSRTPLPLPRPPRWPRPARPAHRPHFLRALRWSADFHRDTRRKDVNYYPDTPLSLNHALMKGKPQRPSDAPMRQQPSYNAFEKKVTGHAAMWKEGAVITECVAPLCSALSPHLPSHPLTSPHTSARARWDDAVPPPPCPRAGATSEILSQYTCQLYGGAETRGRIREFVTALESVTRVAHEVCTEREKSGRLMPYRHFSSRPSSRRRRRPSRRRRRRCPRGRRRAHAGR